MNHLSAELKATANEQAILNLLLYVKFTAKDGDSLEDVVANSDAATAEERRKRQHNVMKNAIANHTGLGRFTIGDQSKYMPGFDDEKGLRACTFANPTTGVVSVVFKGTGTGEWLDNSYALSGNMIESPQQVQALDYFDFLVEKNGYAEKGTHIIVSGHSKGGNKAQYITLNSKYRQLIMECFSFDGQGMSPETIRAMKERHGKKSYLEAIHKMHGFYAENDFIHPWGFAIIPEGERYYFENFIVDEISDFGRHHYVDGYLNEDGFFTTQEECGPITKYVTDLSNRLMAFPLERRAAIVTSFMGAVQRSYGKNQAIDGSEVALPEIINGFIRALPTILTALGRQDGRETLSELAGESFINVDLTLHEGFRELEEHAIIGVGSAFGLSRHGEKETAEGKVYTVTFSPALDYDLHLEALRIGEKQRTSHETFVVGGKGINVSNVLTQLGIKNVALGFIAGFIGAEIERQAQALGIKTDFIRLRSGVSRINVKIRSGAKQQEETDVNARGADIDMPSLKRFYEKLTKIQDGSCLVLSGSIPESLPFGTYKEILQSLSHRPVHCVVDATGRLLRDCLPLKPFLIKPNKEELGELFGKTMACDEDIIKHARRLQDEGARNVLVSKGEEGAVLLTEAGKVFKADAVKGKVVNTAGAGDAMVAGFLAGWLESKDYEKALTLGTAAGSATAFCEGIADAKAIKKLLRIQMSPRANLRRFAVAEGDKLP